MIVTLAEHRRQIKELTQKLKRGSQKKGEAENEIIPLFFKNEDEIIAPYSAGKPSEDAVINPAVIDYLESRAEITPGKKRLTIEIEYRGNPPDDHFLPEKLIKKNLKVSILASVKRNTLLMYGSFALALVGIAILGLINRIPFFSGGYAFNELFIVISWVFMWRFVETFFFERPKIRRRLIRLFKIYIAEYRIKTPDCP